jgi:hypothetical protein
VPSDAKPNLVETDLLADPHMQRVVGAPFAANALVTFRKRKSSHSAAENPIIPSCVFHQGQRYAGREGNSPRYLTASVSLPLSFLLGKWNGRARRYPVCASGASSRIALHNPKSVSDRQFSPQKREIIDQVRLPQDVLL